ncbi:hypothetical protein ABS71_18175 [bacterium SCN 62-11]|nr:MAG: hypothetical protein ABS71_18175 [bacterium SCN 62-11]
MRSHLAAPYQQKFWGLGYYWFFWTAYFVILGDNQQLHQPIQEVWKQLATPAHLLALSTLVLWNMTRFRGVLAALVSLAALPACLALAGSPRLLAGVFPVPYLTLLYAGLPRLTLLTPGPYRDGLRTHP